MKKNSARRTLIMSALSLLLCCAMLIGSTTAWFTDTATSTGNKIQAGTLDIDLVMDKAGDGTYTSIADADAPLFGATSGLAQNDPTDTLWEPGKTQIAYLGVQNKGNLALKYNIILDVADNGLASALEYAIIPGAKAENLTEATSWDDIKTDAGTANIGTVAAGRITAAQNGVLDEIVNGTKNETQYFALAVHMKEEAGNDYQGKNVTIDVSIVAAQYTAESDSFDNQYDYQREPECLTFTCTGLNENSDHATVTFSTDYPALFADKNINVQFKASSTNVQYGDYDSTSPVTGTDWQTYEPGKVLALEEGDSVQFRGNNVGFALPNPDENPAWEDDDYAYWYFWMDGGKIAGSGDVTSLTNGVGGDAKLTDHCYHKMFAYNYWLTSAPNLPSTELAANCYDSMFEGSGLTTAPTLPAKKVAPGCYYRMFTGCPELKTASEILATDLSDGNIPVEYKIEEITKYRVVNRDGQGCCESMYQNCPALTEVPALRAKTLANFCYYNMFTGCTSLVEAPDILAETAACSCCEIMFFGCESLTKAPLLTAKTMAYYCYNSMFLECSSLEEAPALPATKLADHCYEGMFDTCKSLKQAPVLPAEKMECGCYGYMFIRCKSLEIAPALPATELADACYKMMFTDCSALTTAPALPATKLAENCYENMFTRCTSLIVSDSATADATVAWTVPESGTLTNTEDYSQALMFIDCAGTRASNNMAGAAGQSYTYYTQNTPISAD